MVEGHGTARRSARRRRRRRGRRRFSRGWSALGAAAIALPMLLVPATTASAAEWGGSKTVTSGPGPYEPGENVTFVLTFSCSDPNDDPCADTTMTDPLPAPLEIVSADVISGDGEVVADPGTNTAVYTNPGEIPTGDQVQISVIATVPPDTPRSFDGTDVTNSATIVSDNAPELPVEADVPLTVPLVLDSETSKSIDPEGAIASPGTTATMTLGGSNGSNDPVDTLVLQEPAPGTVPNPFTYLGFTGFGDVSWPAGATSAEVTFACADGSTPAETTTDVDTLPGPPAGCVVEGFTVEFTGEIEQGAAASVPVVVEQTEAVTGLTASTTVANTVSSNVTDAEGGASEPTTASDTYVITPPNNAVTAAKSFDPEVVSAGDPTTVTIGATNDGDPITSMTITEPSPGTDSPFEGDDPLTFTGWGTDDDGDGVGDGTVQWPTGADAATVTYSCAEGGTEVVDATAPDTLPDPPAGCTVVGFEVEFTGEIVTGATASLPFTADTDPDQAEDDVLHPNEITAIIPNAEDTDAATVETLTDRLATETTKQISPSTFPALPGQTVVVQLPSQLLPFGEDGSTTNADQVIVQDPTDPTSPDEWSQNFVPTSVRSTDVPTESTLTVNYWDGDSWEPAPGCTFVGPTTASCDLPDDAQGVQFVYDSTGDGFPPGTSFQPNFTASYTGPTDRDAPIENCGASSASSGAVPPTEPAVGCDTVDPFPVPTDPGELDFISKNFLGEDPPTVRARTQDQVTAEITWSTNGFSGVDPMVVSDIADPEGTAVDQSFYDAFDLVSIGEIDAGVDPLIEYDAIVGVELYDGSTWTQAANSTCTTATPCDGGMPAVPLTGAEQASTVSVRITYVESPTRSADDDPTVPHPGEGVARSTQADGRHLDLTFQLRDVRRSDGEPVLGSTEGTIYNLPDDPGTVRDTASGTATFDGTDYTDSDLDDVLVLDQPVNVSITKDWTGGPLSVPPDGTPDEAYPSTHAVITSTNDSVQRVDTLRIAEPSTANDELVVDPETAPGTQPFDAFTLIALAVTAPEGTGTTTVTLTSVGGGTADYTEAEAEALTAADLADVVGVAVEFDGRIVSEAQGVLDLTLQLRELDRYTGERITVDGYSPVPNSAGTELIEPGGTADQQPQAWDTADMELQDAAISMVQTKSFDPTTIVEPGSDAEPNPTSVLTITGQPTGPSRAVEMTLTDVDGSFWNQYDLVGFGGSTLTAPIDQVQVDACVSGTYDETSDTFADCTWTNGTPSGAFALPAGVDPATVTGLRLTFTRADGAIWENPANPVQAVDLEVQVRDTLRSDPGTPVPSDLAQNDPAPGEDAPGIATNDVTSTVTGADLVPDPDDPTGPLVPVSGDAEATSTITYQHTTNGVEIVKAFDGVISGGIEAPADVFPMTLSVTNSGNRPVYDLDVVDAQMPVDAEGPQLRLAEDVDPQITYALEGAAPDPANGDPLPTTEAGTGDQVTADVEGDLEALEFTFPEGTVLEVGQTYTITVMVQFRVGIEPQTLVENTAGVTGDRPWDVCQNENAAGEPIDGTLDAETGQCLASADVTPTAAATLQQRKLVRATSDEYPLGIIVDPGQSGDVTPEECEADADGFYAYPCTPVVPPGQNETWRIRVDNVGNLPMDTLVLYDRLPTPGDTGTITDPPRGSQWTPVLTNDPPPVLAEAPEGAEATFYYTTSDVLCEDDIDTPLDPTCPTDPATGWAELTADVSEDVYSQVTAFKAVVTFDEASLFEPGDFVALDGTTTTPSEAPEAGDESIAWNSAAAGGIVIAQSGDRFNQVPAEGVKVGVATATGSLEVNKAVTGDGAGYAPGTFDVIVQCTSAVGTWVETELDPITVTVTPGVSVTVPNLPYGAECTLTEDDGAGQTDFTVDPASVTIQETAAAGITITNSYDLASLELSKAVESDAVDQDGDPVSYGPFEAAVECTFLDEEVVADGYVPGSPMVVELSGDGAPVALTGLPVNSACTVTETVTAGAAATSMTVAQPGEDPVTTGGTSVDVTIVPDGVVTIGTQVGVTNTYDVGAIDLQKVVDGEGAQAYGTGPFRITVTCTYDDDGDGPLAPRPVYDGTVVLGGAGPLDAEIANLPAGAVCEVAEVDDAGATGAVVVPDTVTVGADETAEVVVTNTFDVGTVEVVKELAGLGALYGPGPFEVELACTYDGVELTVPGGATREFTQGDPAVYDGLPVGAECTVTETDTFGAWSTTITVDDGEPLDGTTVDVVVPDATDGDPTTVTVDMTNTFETSPLVVRKVVDGDGVAFAPAMPDVPDLPTTLEELADFDFGSIPFEELPYAVTLECTDSQGDVVEVVPGGPDRRFGPGFPALYFGLQDGDTCTVTETDDGGATSMAISPDPVVVDGEATFEEPVEVLVTNTYDTGAIVVDKVVEFEGAPYDVGPFEVALECTFQGAGIDVPGGAAREIAAGDTVTYDGLPVGADCVLTETDDGGAAVVEVSGVDDGEPGAVTVAADPASVAVTNTFGPSPPPPAPAPGPDPGTDAASPAWLPRTGGDVRWLIGLAVLVTAAGVVLLTVRRRAS
ncbi:DUF5979 domain-containing protein [Isoptericola sp. NEAU-Y5]|uniref:DUF5979 domain-containing protein n=1 Tax=Isoptericola luteus TaxID=2879484 RepID=A0ABS7ZGR2_9MICO|nr:DUF5979 domain-containing protein [Isoptericola sp. NEAU-Y5]MCA5894205.1 DUF5979 domain-containing protein [Isoptericola sp. NEAU-Y5]